MRIAKLALDEARTDKQIADFPFLNNLATAYRFNSQFVESEALYFELFKKSKSSEQQQRSVIAQVKRLFSLDSDNILLLEKEKWQAAARALGIDWNDETEEEEIFFESPYSSASFPPLQNFSFLHL